MKQTAQSNKVSIFSSSGFIKMFFDYDAYAALRSKGVFGSALNPVTGKPDSAPYVPVFYIHENGDDPLDALSIAKKLIAGEKIILVGDYGTGKSRCVQKIFDLISGDNSLSHSVFAINLRDHWGASTASAIIGGHLEDLGLSNMIDAANQVITCGGAILLLDGLDEVGAQVFGSNKESRRSLRSNALQGVRKLIERNVGGVLVTTRPHYFDSDQEMINSTGFANKKYTILRCQDEFSRRQSSEYLSSIGITRQPPSWLPRKPLVFQIISTIDKNIADNLLSNDCGEYDFWGKFIESICLREARIHGSIESDSVKQILIKLAEKTRIDSDYLGKLSTRDVREAYEFVIQDAPDEAGEQMLMRLCTLGRIGPESPERQFVDEYIVDGLRAEGLISCIDQQSRIISDEVWRQPLRRFGWNLLRENLMNFKKDGLFKSTLSFLMNGKNSQAFAEVLSTMSDCDGDAVDVKSRSIADTEIHLLTIGRRIISGLTINSSYIFNLKIDSNFINVGTVNIEDCQIIEVFGISSERGVPKWIVKSDIEKFESLSTSNRIKNSNLSPQHILFLSVIHRIFFQQGRGRKEQALRKGGFGQDFNPKLLASIIGILMRDGIVERIDGDDGYVYTPVMKHKKRMSEIKSLLSLSEDILWSEIGNLKVK